MTKPKKGDWLTATEYAFHSKHPRSTVQDRGNTTNPNTQIETKTETIHGVRKTLYQWQGPSSARTHIDDREITRVQPQKNKKHKVFAYLDYEIAVWVEGKCQGVKRNRSRIINQLLTKLKAQEATDEGST